MRLCFASPLLALDLFSGALAVSRAQALPLTDVACVPEFNAGNHCVANSLSFKAISIEPSKTLCDEGDTLNLKIGVTVGSGRNRNAAQRYNLGIWVGENVESAIGGSQCTFAVDGRAPETFSNTVSAKATVTLLDTPAVLKIKKESFRSLFAAGKP